MVQAVRDVYLVTEADLADPASASMALNLLLNQINDRLDQLEGTRGISTVQYPIDVVDANGEIIGGFTDVSSR